MRNTIRRLRHTRLHRPDVALPYTIYGSSYGGWPLLDATPHGSLVYSMGIGTDISFDLAVIAALDCRVAAFDPTPKCLAWIQSQSLPSRFQFYPIGVSNEDTNAIFFAPEKPGHVSYSIQPNAKAQATMSIMARVCRIETIAKTVGQSPDILKMDVEGFEYRVVRDLASTSIRPSQLLIEFHHGMYGFIDADTLEAVGTLRSLGYDLFFVSDTGREYAFARRAQ